MSNDESSATALPIPAGECKYCTRPFQKKAFAKHQEFCSRAHRLAWWEERRKRALAALSEAETKKGTAS